jgi:Holliday junction resolvasome RuvABC DNA-binding subunit
MNLRGLSFGGRNAWAYKKLTKGIDVQDKILSLFTIDDTSIAYELSQIDEDQPSLVIDGEFIDLAEVKFLAKKIKWLGEKKALRLLLAYKTIDNIKNIDLVELTSIDGIGAKLASRIHRNI